MMNIITIPFHDWRKIEKEGFRTRDAHFIEHLSKHSSIENLLIINRPTTYVEILYKRNRLRIQGKILLVDGKYQLIQVQEKVFVIDSVSFQIWEHIKQKKLWFFEAYGNNQLVSFVKKSMSCLNIADSFVLSQNIYASEFCCKLGTEKIIFDAWDNWLQFPHFKKIETTLIESYRKYAECCSLWITNSIANKQYFEERFVDKICLIKNGVDKSKFEGKHKKPDDLVGIPNPVIGFGGKITHLFDVDLYNYLLDAHPDKSFVLVGQKLDKTRYRDIIKKDNFYYLGDKHYTLYPRYVEFFDLCIVPYVTGREESGADSIKVYEYLAAGKNVVATKGSGLLDLSEFVFLADSNAMFSKLIDSSLKSEVPRDIPLSFEWKEKVAAVVNCFEKL